MPKSGNLLGGVFGAGRGVIQGDQASPMIFNILVDTVVWVVLEEVCGTQEAHHCLVWAAGKGTWYSMRMMDGLQGGTQIGFRMHCC